MKYIVQWTPRLGADPNQNVKSSESLLKAFGTWEPPEEWTISQFLARVDGRGGQLICETEDIGSIGRTVAQYVAWVDYDIIPVVDVGNNVADLFAGNAWARSAGGIG